MMNDEYSKNERTRKKQRKRKGGGCYIPLEEKESYASQKEEVPLNPPLMQKPIAWFVKSPYLCGQLEAYTIMGLLKSFFSQCARPEGFLGRVMLRFMT